MAKLEQFFFLQRLGGMSNELQNAAIIKAVDKDAAVELLGKTMGTDELWTRRMWVEFMPEGEIVVYNPPNVYEEPVERVFEREIVVG